MAFKAQAAARDAIAVKSLVTSILITSIKHTTEPSVATATQAQTIQAAICIHSILPLLSKSAQASLSGNYSD
tara:strand:- start:44 stop:259 length:216 start_codon:yes stop_codon:yes gene_type:complete